MAREPTFSSQNWFWFITTFSRWHLYICFYMIIKLSTELKLAIIKEGSWLSASWIMKNKDIRNRKEESYPFPLAILIWRWITCIWRNDGSNYDFRKFSRSCEMILDIPCCLGSGVEGSSIKVDGRLRLQDACTR